MTCLEGWDLTALINRLDTNWSLSLRPLYMTPNLGCASSCLISHFVALRVTVSGSDWGDPLEISLRKAGLMDETSSHLQSQLTTPVSSSSNTNTLTHRQTHTSADVKQFIHNTLVLSGDQESESNYQRWLQQLLSSTFGNMTNQWKAKRLLF